MLTILMETESTNSEPENDTKNHELYPAFRACLKTFRTYYYGKNHRRPNGRKPGLDFHEHYYLTQELMSSLKCCQHYYDCDVDCKVSKYQNYTLKEGEMFNHISNLTFELTNRANDEKLIISDNPTKINSTLEAIENDTKTQLDQRWPKCHIYHGPSELGGDVGPTLFKSQLKLSVIPPARFVTCMTSEWHRGNVLCKRNEGSCSLVKPVGWPNGNKTFSVTFDDKRILCTNSQDTGCTEETITLQCGHRNHRKLSTTFNVSFIDFSKIQNSTEEIQTTPQTPDPATLTFENNFHQIVAQWLDNVARYSQGLYNIGPIDWGAAEVE